MEPLDIRSKNATVEDMEKRAATKTRDPGLDTFAQQQAKNLESAKYRRAAVLESIRIATVETIIDELDEAREALAMSKEELARSISAHGSVVRRLFSSPEASPNLTSVAEVAASLGMRIVVVPMEPKEREEVLAALHPAAAGDMYSIAALPGEAVVARVTRPVGAGVVLSPLSRTRSTRSAPVRR